ncbi:sulfonate transport system permease protein [Herbaspirillum sp. Sphag1AN]|uniref:ABC transporter permease n=1 Tax=unclassified Herbaspirillum TaxID=2624150 RepID=UPI00161DB72B|nr:MULTISPECIES: ABC transporter permease [unclassified Herbaspirillum]MBB3214638.1 sulfonate transport system permease protein [Herbaspirillum sp. Sphag1AN]MBB3247834.1 sulfonate transport system permease protein [Herbaspirillum sp. Sphag64]
MHIESHALSSHPLSDAETDFPFTDSAGTHKPTHTDNLDATRLRHRSATWSLGALLPLLVLSLLELGGARGWIPEHLLPPPSEIAQTIVNLAGHDLAIHVLASVTRVAVGFALGSLLAIGFGLLVGMQRQAEALLEPSFQALRAIPSLAWVPLLLLWLGIDETPKIVLIAIGAFFPVYINLVAGIHSVDRKLLELAKIHGLSSREVIRRIVLPSALPQLFTGLRTGLSLAWMFLVAAEMMAATKGVGYLLSDGRESSRPDIVLAAILILAIMGKLSDSILKRIETRKLAWRDVLVSSPR